MLFAATLLLLSCSQTKPAPAGPEVPDTTNADSAAYGDTTTASNVDFLQQAYDTAAYGDTTMASSVDSLLQAFGLKDTSFTVKYRMPDAGLDTMWQQLNDSLNYPRLSSAFEMTDAALDSLPAPIKAVLSHLGAYVWGVCDSLTEPCVLHPMALFYHDVGVTELSDSLSYEKLQRFLGHWFEQDTATMKHIARIPRNRMTYRVVTYVSYLGIHVTVATDTISVAYIDSYHAPHYPTILSYHHDHYQLNKKGLKLINQERSKEIASPISFYSVE